MPDNSTKIRLCEQNLAKLNSSFSYTVNKDELRARITATKAKLKQLKAEHNG